MAHLATELSKYLMIILFMVYTFESFYVFRGKLGEKGRSRIYKRQTAYIFLIHLDAFALILYNEQKLNYVLFYAAQVVYLVVLLFVYTKLYNRSSRLVANHMCMLLSIGFIMLTRLDFDKAVRQFEIAVIALGITIIVPLLINKLRFFDKLTWLYAVVGILALGVVAVIGSTSYGAQLSLSVGGISMQFSEFIKIVFVFFVAAMFTKSVSFRQVVVTTMVAIIHVGILVLSKDLGAALIFFVVYIVMLYVATRRIAYLLLGVGLGALASVICYKLFNHVRVRVIAWMDPLAVYQDAGYQIAHSLFAISTGGWFGMGLYKGAPDTIPVVTKDLIFSAICEEMGIVFGFCIILVCASLFMMFLNISMQIKKPFYKMIALGLGTVYGFQVFLTIGGVTKCIPLTGVTLPLVSYGGSSLLATFLMFAIIQGLYLKAGEKRKHIDDGSEDDEE